MRHNNSDDNSNSSSNNNRRCSSLLSAALSVAAASRSHPYHHYPRQLAAAARAPTAAAAAAASVATVTIAGKVSHAYDGDDDDEHGSWLTDSITPPPLHQAGGTYEAIERLAISIASEIRATRPIISSDVPATKLTMDGKGRATKPRVGSQTRATKPMLASEKTATMLLGIRSSSNNNNSNNNNNNNNSRCSAGLLATRVTRGGCADQKHRLLPGKARSRKRPLRRFLAPALVWAFAAVVEYDLWWKLGPAEAVPAVNGDTSTKAFGSVIGRAAEAIAVNRAHFVCFHVLLVLVLLSHVAVTVADPGFCPPHEGSLLEEEQARESGRWCGHCQAFKPPRAHHCRRCGGCVARMDHHCIYAANCIGAGNHKQFVLLLLYSAACAAHANLLYFRVLGHGPVGGSAQSVSSGVAEAAVATVAPTAAQYSASAWQGPSTSASWSWSSWWLSRLSLPFIRGGGGGGGGAEPRGWRGVASVARGLLLPVLAVAVLSWLVALLSVHLYGVSVDAGTVDRMQAASAASAATGPVASESAAECGRRSLLYRRRAAPSRGGFPAHPDELFGFLEREQGTGVGSTGTSNNDSSSSVCGAAAAPSAVGESARSAALSLACRREITFQGVADYPQRSVGRAASTVVDSPRGPLGRVAATAATAGVVDASGEDFGGAREAASLCSRRGLWRTLREEVLGDGPWVMWFVPSPAKLAPEVHERVFAPPQDQEGGRHLCGSGR